MKGTIKIKKRLDPGTYQKEMKASKITFLGGVVFLLMTLIQFVIEEYIGDGHNPTSGFILGIGIMFLFMGFAPSILLRMRIHAEAIDEQIVHVNRLVAYLEDHENMIIPFEDRRLRTIQERLDYYNTKENKAIKQKKRQTTDKTKEIKNEG